jgi:hypothetical protein
MSARKSFAGAMVGICACLITGMVPFADAQIQHRTTLSLDGQWDIEDSTWVPGSAGPSLKRQAHTANC